MQGNPRINLQGGIDRFDLVDTPDLAESDETEWNFKLGARWE